MNDFTKMGNEEIGEFCQKTHRKMAKDVYAIAKAIKVVHERIDGKKGEFMAWRIQYVPYLSKATIYRYLNVAKLDPAQIGENEGITELYKRFFILPATPPVKTPPISGETGTGTTTAVTEVAPASNAEEAAKVNEVTSPADEIGMSVSDSDSTTSPDTHSQDEDMTPEQEEKLRAEELAAALIVAEKMAAKHGISGDQKNLVAFLGEFGVDLVQISALDIARALAAA